MDDDYDGGWSAHCSRVYASECNLRASRHELQSGCGVAEDVTNASSRSEADYYEPDFENDHNVTMRRLVLDKGCYISCFWETRSQEDSKPITCGVDIYSEESDESQLVIASPTEDSARHPECQVQPRYLDGAEE